MKKRNGFVSNSSSSSFIVAFPTIPENEDELRKMLFGDEIYYSSWEEERWPTTVVAKTVWDDMQRPPLTEPEAIEIVSSGSFDDYPDCQSFEKEDGKIDWDKYQAAVDKKAKEYYNKFAQQVEGIKLFKFHYSDDSGAYESALEHGDLFRRLRHLQISHH